MRVHPPTPSPPPEIKQAPGQSHENMIYQPVHCPLSTSSNEEAEDQAETHNTSDPCESQDEHWNMRC